MGAIEMYNMDHDYNYKSEYIPFDPSGTVLEGYYALAMDLPDSDNETRVKEMINGSQGIISITISQFFKT